MKDFLKLIWRNPMALTGVIILSIFILGAIAAPLITKHVPDKRTGNPHEYPGFVVKSAQTNPGGWVAQNLADDRRTLIMSKKADHVLGTTRMGRDVWSQVVYGARVSLAVGFGAGLTVCLLATVIGVSAGYFGGRVDDVLTAAMNIMLVIPQYPLLFVVAAFIGEAGPLTITLVIGFMSWAWGARVVRSQTLALREKEFVKAAEVLGESSFRIIFVEILPNLISIVGASFIGSVMYAIMMEATISFLGLGDPNTISWGIMLYNVQTSSSMLIGAWWELLAPCIALTLLVTGLALLNFAVDEIANPQLRSHKGMKRWKKLAAQDKEEREPELPPQNALWSGDK
ncbi:peptide/nickel transport system permease protein [Vibrio crassostreae]|uniref:Putative ABC-type dipeptide/oligopeptide/nickel transport system, permease component n=1 Tax=Vibrio crassostreae TaxID=246167 RepID=A0A822MW43_9VIBR|nr:ABC transporter permease [Vibrio crassostreae]MDH5949234.1 ABC transporter permease [Vibrio crassostreae]TCN13252.1 peptide/nickel transport system permease protein [Vibrio crassostreae]TCT73463.1 peptide/nickel transport system permease protein [Vibrio crassostreae]TCU09140.1 peptide/nickel transport system permease protein [Vibrio crassostreae]CAK1733797.1 peptide/nickel transport system permease protein [Vibrio crassostreae]